MFYLTNIESCYSQKNSLIEKDLNFINNKTLKYSIAVSQDDFFFDCDTIINDDTLLIMYINQSLYRVLVCIHEKEDSIIKKIDYHTWMKLLHSKSNDFAANLILYSIYERHAKTLSVFNTVKRWRKSGLKNDDIEYWKNYLTCPALQITPCK